MHRTPILDQVADLTVVAHAIAHLDLKIVAISSDNYYYDVQIQTDDYRSLLTIANDHDLDVRVTTPESRSSGNANADGTIRGLAVHCFTAAPRTLGQALDAAQAVAA